MANNSAAPDRWCMGFRGGDPVKRKIRAMEEMIEGFYFDTAGLLRCMFHLDKERGEIRPFRPEDHAGQSLPKLPSDAVTPDGYHMLLAYWYARANGVALD